MVNIFTSKQNIILNGQTLNPYSEQTKNLQDRLNESNTISFQPSTLSCDEEIHPYGSECNIPSGKSDELLCGVKGTVWNSVNHSRISIRLFTSENVFTSTPHNLQTQENEFVKKKEEILSAWHGIKVHSSVWWGSIQIIYSLSASIVLAIREQWRFERHTDVSCSH